MTDRPIRIVMAVSAAVAVLGGAVVLVDARTATDVTLFGYEQTMLRIGLGVLMVAIAAKLLAGGTAPLYRP